MFTPLLSVVGGLFIGSASGVYMLAAHRISGCSGSLKALLLGKWSENHAPLGFLAGLILSGIAASQLAPDVFEPLLDSDDARDELRWLTLIVGGLLVGFGAKRMNGCTSGHGIWQVILPPRAPTCQGLTPWIAVLGLAAASHGSPPGHWWQRQSS